MDFSSVAAILTDPSNLLMGFVAVLSFATFVTLASPLLSRSTLENRLNSVANRREELKRRSREALAASKTHGGSLRHADEGAVKTIVHAPRDRNGCGARGGAPRARRRSHRRRRS